MQKNKTILHHKIRNFHTVNFKAVHFISTSEKTKTPGLMTTESSVLVKRSKKSGAGRDPQPTKELFHAQNDNDERQLDDVVVAVDVPKKQIVCHPEKNLR